MNKSIDNVINRLEEFSRSYHRSLIFRGLASCLSVLLVFFIIICVIEYFSFLNSTFRKIIFWTYLSISAILIVKLVIIPILKLFLSKNSPNENKRVAKLIGQHFPEIEDRLINILELNELDYSSKELINASIDKKYIEIKSYSFKNAIDWKKTINYLKTSSFPIIFILIVFFSGNTGFISQASNRIINYNSEFSPPPPFKFIIQNDKLEVLEKKDFKIEVNTVGKKLPEEVFVKYNDNSYKMNLSKNGGFHYEFKDVEDDILFYLYSKEVRSANYNLVTLPAPILNIMEVTISPPKHTKQKVKKYKNTGSVSVPEGSVVNWEFQTINTNLLNLSMRDSTINLKPDSTGLTQFKMQVVEPFKYVVSTSNSHTSFKDSLYYNVDVIKDSHPSISIDELTDTIEPLKRLVTGTIQDDYGFLKLIFTAQIKNIDEDTIINKKIKIKYNSNNQTFLEAFDISKLPLKAGGKLEYFFTVYDNDKINNYKRTSSKKLIYKKPSKNEVLEKLDQDNEKIEKELEDQLTALENLSKEIENIEKALIDEKMDWKTKAKIENLLKNYQALEKQLREIDKKIDSTNKKRNEVQSISEKLLEKQKLIEELFQKLMPEEMKELFKELENSIEDIDKKELQEKIEQLKLSNLDIEKEIDRNLELLKQFEFEKKLEEAIDELNNLSKKEEDLSKKTIEKNSDLNKLKVKQEANIEEFKNLKEKLKELKEIKKELENKAPLETEDLEKNIQETMENSLEQINKKRKKQASKSQKSSADQLSKLKNKLKEQQKEESMEQQVENIETLRQILENLIFFSKSEEELMVQMNSMDSNDPQYIQLMYKQGDLRNDAKVIEDSLFALSKRIPQISATVNREIGIIQEKTNEAIDYLRERETFKGTAKQQYVMTSANNLAVLLGEILEQIQKELSSDLPSSQECQKPGNGKPKPGDLKKMQKELQEHMEKMQRGEVPGPSEQGFSKELVEMLAKQERIRMALKEFENSLDKKEDIKSLKNAIENMEKTEQDIVNKNITIETLRRQQQIMNKLLELDSALREEGESKERESTEGINSNSEKNVTLKYELLKKYQKELLNTYPPSLTNYYKEKVDNYFNSLIKEDL